LTHHFWPIHMAKVIIRIMLNIKMTWLLKHSPHFCAYIAQSSIHPCQFPL
jgi:hypothetical protein